jgi:hypothetical protein
MTTGKWVRFTWFGWLLGVPFVAGLALVGEAIGFGGAQGLVGAGMGAGVGAMQALALRRILNRPLWWFVSSTVGLAIPFVAFDLGRSLGRNPTYSVLGSVAMGGIIVGAWQSRLLRAVLPRSALWAVLCFAGWLAAALAAAGADWEFRAHKVAGLAGALLYLGLIAMGGLALGLITAPLAARMRSGMNSAR